jgi:hypothetical protein
MDGGVPNARPRSPRRPAGTAIVVLAADLAVADILAHLLEGRIRPKQI